VVAIAGILRERMLFNMSEDEWDAVIETHLKGHFTVFRAASAIMRKQEGGGSLVAFTSGAFAGSVAQANYAAAKGGIVSLVHSAAAGLNRYGITANAVAPVARTRMSANVPMDLAEMGDPEDVSPRWSSTCCRIGPST
jgi:NAD(P)-dependent dehydrogenase (short-subunit alcohol dehydrogenase family)